MGCLPDLLWVFSQLFLFRFCLATLSATQKQHKLVHCPKLRWRMMSEFYSIYKPVVGRSFHLKFCSGFPFPGRWPEAEFDQRLNGCFPCDIWTGKNRTKKISEITIKKAILYINDGIITNNKRRREQITDGEKQDVLVSSSWGNFFFPQKRVKPDGYEKAKLYQNGFSEIKPKSNMSHFSNITQLKLWM